MYTILVVQYHKNNFLSLTVSLEESLVVQCLLYIFWTWELRSLWTSISIWGQQKKVITVSLKIMHEHKIMGKEQWYCLIYIQIWCQMGWVCMQALYTYAFICMNFADGRVRYFCTSNIYRHRAGEIWYQVEVELLKMQTFKAGDMLCQVVVKLARDAYL